MKEETRRLRAKHKKSHDFDCMMYRQYERQIEELQAEISALQKRLKVAELSFKREPKLREEIAQLKDSIKYLDEERSKQGHINAINMSKYQEVLKEKQDENAQLKDSNIFKYFDKKYKEENATLKKQLNEATSNISRYHDDTCSCKYCIKEIV